MSTPAETGLKHRLKTLAFRAMRPGIMPVHDKMMQIEADIKALGDRLDEREERGRKYDSELDYWRWLIKRGGSEKDFGAPFEQVFGHWQRQRLLKLGLFLGLPDSGTPGDVDDWCATRSVIEIGAGPYPAIAAARKGWKRCVAVDPIARGYVEEDLVPKAAEHVIYIAAPGEQIPLPNGFADLLVIENCLDHVTDPSAVAQEMYRLLRPGGYLWLFVDLSNHRDHMHPHAFNEDKVRAVLGDFRVVRDEVSAHKAHPQAYGGYRGLLRKPDAAGDYRARPESAQNLRPVNATNGANTDAHVEIKVREHVNGSVSGRPQG
jgi:SAM-dependent methyltransferase